MNEQEYRNLLGEMAIEIKNFPDVPEACLKEHCVKCMAAFRKRRNKLRRALHRAQMKDKDYPDQRWYNKKYQGQCRILSLRKTHSLSFTNEGYGGNQGIVIEQQNNIAELQ